MGNAQNRQCVPHNTAHRRASISWNFRYPIVRKREHTTVMVYNSKMSISEWLDLLNLQQYEANLQMYNYVDDLVDIDEKALKRKGIRTAAHRNKMLTSLLGIQAKRRQSVNLDGSRTTGDVLRRKNSCPPDYLPPVDTSKSADSVSLIDGNFYTVTKSGKILKHLTFDESSNSALYEPLRTPSSKPTTPLSKIYEHYTNNNNNDTNMDNVSVSNGAIINTNEQQEAIALKKALEWELSLDSRELRSHAWYHGPLPRQRAEEIVQREGDFLVRDCTSQPDNYVLTCRTKNAVLHFVINKILLQPETVYERVQYQFEEDAFDAVPDLITFYVGSGKPISAASGARIQYPCNRTYPLSFYGHKIVGNQLHTQMLTGLRAASPLNSPMSNNGVFRFNTNNASGSQLQLSSPSQQQQLPVSQNQSPMSSPPQVKRDVPPRLPSKKQRSQSLTPAQAMVVSNIKNADQTISHDLANDSGSNSSLNSMGFRETRRLSNFEKSTTPSEAQLGLQQQLTQMKINGNGFQTIARCTTSSDMIVERSKFTTHSLPRPTSAAQALRSQAVARISNLARNFSMDTARLGFGQIPELPEKPPSPPPKPGRQLQPPAMPRKEKELQQLAEQIGLQRAGAVLAYQASGSDSGNGSGDSVQSSAPGDAIMECTQQRGVIIKNPRFMSTSASNNTLKSFTEFDAIATEELLFTLEIPELKLSSKFDFENFSTLLLPSVENKPLDGDALNTFKMMLLETGPRLIAEHITRIDVILLLDEPNDETIEMEQNCLNCCGLELLTLPHGKIFRDDLIERTQCIKLMVAVTILTCQTDMDRAELLSKWIQIAVETKTALGNLFSFCAIMLGLCMQQIQKLDQAWHILRQKFTDSAFTFEAKLRPTLISMNECTNPQAPNTTVPHVLLYALLIDRPVLDIINTTNIADRPVLYTTCITPWESKADDFGMFINFQHLDSARGFLKNLNLYRKNAKIINEDATSRMDELLSDAFRTEFHVKFLWGSTGALAKPEDRHTKLEKVLSLMADKFCNANNANTA